MEQGQDFSNSDPSIQPKRGQGEPDLAGSRGARAHGAPCGGWVQNLVPSREPGEDNLPEDHLHQACQEDQVCPAAPKTNSTKSTAAMVSLQSIGGWSFSDTFLALPSCERLQRGHSDGKAAMTCQSLLISLGRVSQHPEMLSASPIHTTRQ